MAFETVDQWQVDRSFGWPNGNWKRPSFPENWPFRDQLQKFSSGLFSIGLNGFVLYVLITAGFNKAFEQEPVQSTGEITSMTLMEIEEASEETPSTLAAADSETGPTALGSAAPTPIETSVETPVPPEWSRSRIQVPRLVSNEAVSPTPSGSGAGQNDASGAGDKSGIYDPFAGAAPNRKPDSDTALRAPERQPSLASRLSNALGFGEPVTTDKQDAFENWVAGLRKRLPRAKGTVQLSVQTASNGLIKSSEIVGGSASPQVKFFVRNAAIGQKLSGLGARNSGSVTLPVIRLN
ncbi:MAG: hypothetical protein ABJO01_09885 [Parasphingorhabdus sp.]|uniref:hypothetical protein n=1 Tax=Parasphingorhabdus sp. TaxID=2709688 RepID=UPI00329822B6